MNDGKRFFIYRNITKSKDKHVYSMRSKEDNRVKGHASNFLLTNVKFKVSDVGRERVRREGVKNVHAGVEGTLTSKSIKGPWIGVTYDPKKTLGFIRRDNGQPISEAKAAKFTPEGVMIKAAFLKGFYKHAEALRKEVSTVAVMKDGKMLMGKRRDNGKWTAPGGHLDKGEEPLAGAVRELYEESGIEADPKDLKFIRTITNKENGYVVHGYRYDVSGKLSTSMKNDPDGEVYRWHFVNPDTVDDKDLHVPRAKGNVLLGQEKTARRLPPIKYRKILKQIEDNFPEITKSEKLMTYPFQNNKKSKMEKEAFLKGLGKGLLAASLTAGTAMPAKALSVGSKATSSATRAAYKEVKRNKDVLKNKFLPSKATETAAAKGSAAAPAISKEKGVMERAYEGLKDTDKNLQKNYGLKIRDKVEKTFDGGKVSLNALGRSASVDYKSLGADYNKGNLRLRGKINDNTTFTLDPKNKGASLAWSKSF